MKLVYKSGPYSDETCYYDVKTSAKTVREFVDEAIQFSKDASRHIPHFSVGYWKGTEYFDCDITTDNVLNTEIIEPIRCNAGWGMYHYFINIHPKKQYSVGEPNNLHK